MRLDALIALFFAAVMCGAAAPATECAVDLVVLGVAQDGGAPQLGQNGDPAWSDPTLRRTATALGLRDSASGRRWLFEATPDIRDQLHRFDSALPASHNRAGGLDGVFLTHAHIGHYAGLMFFGHESMGASGLTVYAMPRMAAFLEGSGPWSQLVRYGNIRLDRLADGAAVALTPDLSVTPFLVPHRQEYSEVVGYRIDGPDHSALFIPDIDSWADWDAAGGSIEAAIRSVDVAFLDATFFADGEIPGRDMSGFPHPFVVHTMTRLAELPEAERAKVRFIHYNHTNPLRFDPARRAQVQAAGFNVALEGERHCLQAR